MIHPTAYIGPNVTFASREEVSVGPYASIEGGPGYETRIGRDVVIGPGARIGQAGFGYEWTSDGWQFKQHHHGIVIDDDVHIGANTCIDRGSWRETRISRGTRIDNLVHIAHNVYIDQCCCIVAQAEISGSVQLAAQVYVGPGAKIRERLIVGEGSIIGMGSVVVKDVPAGMVVAGVPARVMKAVDEWPPPPPPGHE